VPVFTGFARAVLEGHVPGQVWIDRTEAPRAAHALHSYGMSLVWGAQVDAVFPELSAHLRQGSYRTRDEWLQINPRWNHLDWDEAFGDAAQRFTRVNFRFDETLFRARHNGPALPQGWRIAAMGEGSFALPDISVTPRAFWQDLAAFRDHGGGVCAVRDGDIGALAFSATRFDDWLEIGIETRAAYRGQGLARAVAVAMIENCLAQGLTPVWACRKENTGSLHLAQSLGFVITKELPFYRLLVGV
jgi:RimJ/RimL family protein N-acetyltransferase